MAQIPALQFPQLQSPLESQAKVMNLQALYQQQKLGAEQLRGAQMQNQEQEQSIRDSQAYREVIAKYNGDIEKALPELSKTVSPKTYMGIQQSLMAQKKSAAEFEKMSTENKLKVLELGSKRAERIGQLAGAATDQSTYEQAIGMGVQEGLWDDKTAQSMLSHPYDPNAVKFIQQQALSSAEQLTQNLNELKFSHQQTVDAANIQHQQNTEALTKRGQDITVRGQNMTDTRSRENNDIQRSNKVEQKKSADMTQLTEFESDMDRLATAAKDLLDHPGLGSITGIRGAIPNIPGTDAANAAAKLHNLKTQVAFGTLQKMRNASKTGGALGQVSDNEQKMLMNSVQPLDGSQSNAELRKSLQGIIDYADGAKSRARTAVEQRYASAPAASTQASGFSVTDPNGGVHTFKSQAAAQAFERAIKQGKK